MAGIVHSINISSKKGEQKTPLDGVIITSQGLEGDAHAGPWHRQVSLLAKERIDEFGTTHGATYRNGDFAENITTYGIDLDQVAVGDRLQAGEALLEISQIGKECHGDGCAIFRQAGVCVMPRQGLFARVLRAGHVKAGDTIEHIQVPLQILVLTVSDRVSRGEYEDLSGPAIVERLKDFYKESRRKLNIILSAVPDEKDPISAAVKGAIGKGVNFVFTTGGTGIGKRDITPEAIGPLIEKALPGIMEAVRVTFGKKNPGALISRSIAGCAGSTLVYCLPGSVRAVNEYMDIILPTLDHSMRMIEGVDHHG